MKEIKTFKDYLFEARVGSKQANRAASLVSKVIAKRIGEKLYRFGGPDGYQEYGGGVGYLYIAPSGKAIRLNNENGDFVSASVWQNFKTEQPADFTVDFNGVNMVQLVDTLANIVHSPRAGNVEVDIQESTEKIYSAIENLSEARRVSASEFEQIIKQNLEPSEDPNSLRMSRIAEIANENNVSIPTSVRRNKTGRGRHSVEASGGSGSSSSSSSSPSSSSTTKGNVDLYVKVTARDNTTNKFLSVRDNKEAQELTKKIRNSLQDPTEEDIKNEIVHPDTLFNKLYNLTRLVLRGIKNSFVIYGGPGTGKSYTVESTIEEYGLQRGKDWYLVKGKITTASLYQTLFMHRDGKLLVFDDTDSVWNDKEAANILKAALDSYDDRVISWNSSRTVPVSLMSPEEREEFNNELDAKLKENPDDSKIRYPSEFNYNGSIIFISNLSRDKFDTAVLSRSAKIDMTLTQEQIFLRMESIIEYIEGNKFKGVPVEAKKEVLRKMKDVIGTEIEEANMRTFIFAIDLYKSGLPDWETYLGNM